MTMLVVFIINIQIILLYLFIIQSDVDNVQWNIPGQVSAECWWSDYKSSDLNISDRGLTGRTDWLDTNSDCYDGNN